LGEVVTSENTSENIDEDCFDIFIIIKEFKSHLKLLTLSTATNIQEVGWLTTVGFDDIHGRHGETSTVNQTTDVTADMDVVEVKLRGDSFLFILLALVLLLSQVLLSVGGVAINSNLAISGEESTVLGYDERVNFNHVAISLHEAIVDIGKHINYLILHLRKTKVFSCLNQVIFVNTVDGINLKLENLLRVSLCNIFNRHTTSRAKDKGGAASFSIESETEVELLVDGKLFHDVHGVAWQTVSSRLLGNQGLSAHLVSNVLNLVDSIDNVHTTLESGFLEMAETTTTTKDLGLDDILDTLLGTHFGGLSTSFLGRESDVTERNTNLVAVEKSTSLILVKFHAAHRQVLINNKGFVGFGRRSRSNCPGHILHAEHVG